MKSFTTSNSSLIKKPESSLNIPRLRRACLTSRDCRLSVVANQVAEWAAVFVMTQRFLHRSGR